MPQTVRKILLVAMPACVIAGLTAMLAVELWVRATWDERRGTPGFFLRDASRGQRLAIGYSGWFAGVPVKINQLGFRDDREYTAAKPPGTFRILVFGDSVTFGHGARFETTYPYLLERRLKAWRPDVQWEVWNMGVPGYNTRQELAYLQEVGPRFDPDLVVIGFYPNDFTGNEQEPATGMIAEATSALVRLLQRNLYSFEFYKRVYLTARWAVSREDTFKRRLEHLQTEAELGKPVEPFADAPEQALTSVDYFNAEEVSSFVCVGKPQVDETLPGELAQRIRAESPEVKPWLDSVRALQRLAREQAYRIVFFINMAPETCADFDRFYNGGALNDERILLEVLGNGTPVASSGRAFLHYRPSQMPVAAGHSLGNSNRVKADVLFDLLQQRVLPPLLHAGDR